MEYINEGDKGKKSGRKNKNFKVILLSLMLWSKDEYKSEYQSSSKIYTTFMGYVKLLQEITLLNT